MTGERALAALGGWWERRDRWWIVATVVALVYVWLQWAPALIPWPAEYASLPGDAGDNRLNLLFLEHAYQWLMGREALFASGFYYPLADVGAFSDLLVGTVPPYAAARLVGFDLYDSLRIWVAIGLLVDFGAAYVVARRFALSGPGAILVAIVFTFAAPMAAQAGHLQLLWRPYVPFAFCWAWQLGNGDGRRRRELVRPAIRLLGWLGFGWLCSPVMALLTGFAAAFVVISIVALRWVRAEPRSPMPVAGRGARLGDLLSIAAIGAAAVVAVGYWRASADYGISRWLQGGASSPRLWSWFDASQSIVWAPVSGLLPKVDFYWETQLFVGLGAAAAIGYGLWHPKLHRWRVPFALAVLGAVALLTVSARVSPFVLLTQLPGLNAIRTPGRMILALLFPLGMLAASGLAVARARLPWKGFAAFGLVVVLDLALVTIPASTEASWRERADEVAARAQPIVAGATGPVALLDVAGTDLDGMLAARLLGIPSINGYSGFIAFTIPEDLDCPTAGPWLESFGDDLPASWPRMPGSERATVVVVDAAQACSFDVGL